MIVEYLVVCYFEKGILFVSLFVAVKVCELVEMFELYFEWMVCEVYMEVFFGGKVSDGMKVYVEKCLLCVIDVFK